MGLTHEQIEERSIVLHRVIAQRINENPALLDLARHNLRRWIGQQGERLYWTEWEKILEDPMEEILAFMVSPTERARRLRQSSPFCGILTPRERFQEFLKLWEVYILLGGDLGPELDSQSPFCFLETSG